MFPHPAINLMLTLGLRCQLDGICQCYWHRIQEVKEIESCYAKIICLDGSLPWHTKRQLVRLPTKPS